MNLDEKSLAQKALILAANLGTIDGGATGIVVRKNAIDPFAAGSMLLFKEDKPLLSGRYKDYTRLDVYASDANPAGYTTGKPVDGAKHKGWLLVSRKLADPTAQVQRALASKTWFDACAFFVPLLVDRDGRCCAMSPCSTIDSAIAALHETKGAVLSSPDITAAVESQLRTLLPDAADQLLFGASTRVT